MPAPAPSPMAIEVEAEVEPNHRSPSPSPRGVEAFDEGDEAFEGGVVHVDVDHGRGLASGGSALSAA